MGVDHEIIQAACNANELCESTNILETVKNCFDKKAYYSVTVKNIKKGYFASQTEVLTQLIQLELKHKGKVHDFTFELDSLGRNHIHAVMEARKGIRYNLYKNHYWHFDIKRLDTYIDLVRWVSYMHKEDEESISEYFTNGEYHFLGQA